jgi:hypothetical protein
MERSEIRDRPSRTCEAGLFIVIGDIERHLQMWEG